MENDQSVKKPIVRKWLWLLLLFLILVLIALWLITRDKGNKNVVLNATNTPIAKTSSTPTPKPSATPAKTPTPVPTPTPVVADYTDATYGFSFDYPDAWGNCKLKEATVTGSEKTYYINCPTNDQSFAAGDSLQFPGYFSPLALSVYTPAQWTANQKEEVERSALITQNNSYVFGWNQSNGQLPSDWTNAQWNDHQKLLDTFKLN